MSDDKLPPLPGRPGGPPTRVFRDAGEMNEYNAENAWREWSAKRAEGSPPEPEPEPVETGLTAAKLKAAYRAVASEKADLTSPNQREVADELGIGLRTLQRQTKAKGLRWPPTE